MRAFRTCALTFFAAALLFQGASVGQQMAAADWSRDVWSTALAGRTDDLLPALNRLPEDEAPGVSRVRGTIASLDANIAQRETDRIKRVEELNAEIDQALADAQKDSEISKAILSAINLHLVTTDKSGFLSQDRTQRLIRRGEQAARAAEARGDWLIAYELFARLDALLDDRGTFRRDAERQARRLAMLRLYIPRQFWEMRNAQLLADGEKGLGEYNGAADDWRQKLNRIEPLMVIKALERAGRDHVEQTPVNSLVLGGLDALETMTSTKDLQAAFPALEDEQARAAFIREVRAAGDEVRGLSRSMSVPAIAELIDRIDAANSRTVKFTREALLHEFGNGAMARLDEFSNIIWPDELGRFERSTQGRFVGVGIQIEFNELRQVRVSTPLERSPAFRAGIRAGDVIKSVDGQTLFGISSLDQAVELITGPINTKVVLTIERPALGDAAPETIDFPLTRSQIEVRTVKGWNRCASCPGDWDWFIDPDARIGYIRLTQFAENSVGEFDRAIAQMRASRGGLNGLILDLRYNPGGYLDQAIHISRRFVQTGPIVGIVNSRGEIEAEEYGTGVASLRDLPVAVLVNESSASASEIVSGAIRHYADAGRIQAVLIGQRTFGKGSVQDVTQLSGRARLKLTKSYYTLPDRRVIHRKPNAANWGVEPNLKVDMIPSQVTAAINIRKDADILPTEDMAEFKPADPTDLFTKGADVQLQTALVLLQANALGKGRVTAQREPVR